MSRTQEVRKSHVERDYKKTMTHRGYLVVLCDLDYASKLD